ncbi:12043_t:CDS:1, partial [Racocetra persica]
EFHLEETIRENLERNQNYTNLIIERNHLRARVENLEEMIRFESQHGRVLGRK